MLYSSVLIALGGLSAAIPVQVPANGFHGFQGHRGTNPMFEVSLKRDAEAEGPRLSPGPGSIYTGPGYAVKRDAVPDAEASENLLRVDKIGSIRGPFLAYRPFGPSKGIFNLPKRDAEAEPEAEAEAEAFYVDPRITRIPPHLRFSWKRSEHTVDDIDDGTNSANENENSALRRPFDVGGSKGWIHRYNLLKPTFQTRDEAEALYADPNVQPISPKVETRDVELGSEAEAESQILNPNRIRPGGSAFARAGRMPILPKRDAEPEPEAAKEDTQGVNANRIRPGEGNIPGSRPILPKREADAEADAEADPVLSKWNSRHHPWDIGHLLHRDADVNAKAQDSASFATAPGVDAGVAPGRIDTGIRDGGYRLGGSGGYVGNWKTPGIAHPGRAGLKRDADALGRIDRFDGRRVALPRFGVPRGGFFEHSKTPILQRAESFDDTVNWRPRKVDLARPAGVFITRSVDAEAEAEAVADEDASAHADDVGILPNGYDKREAEGQDA